MKQEDIPPKIIADFQKFFSTGPGGDENVNERQRYLPFEYLNDRGGKAFQPL
jgi:hypothetical protein